MITCYKVLSINFKIYLTIAFPNVAFNVEFEDDVRVKPLV